MGPWFSLLVACSSPAPAPEAVPARTPASAPAPLDPGARGQPRRNAGPRIAAVTLTPGRPTHTDAIDAKAEVRDPEGDPVTLAWAWYLNDRKLPGEVRARLSSGPYRKGDRIVAEVTATSEGGVARERSEPVTIGNTGPVMRTESWSVSTLPGTTFRAEDPDGDTLTWSLEGAPAGMTIDRNGTVRYQGSEQERGGDYRVAVIASDGEAFARFEVPVRVSAGKAAARPATPDGAKAPGTAPAPTAPAPTR
ncbi:MAG: hypothetical protein RLZZ299_626 [Pseudomonadota bacterium]|jgi:hypothetical protein